MTKKKVFGIGFHKTATTSLAVALFTLGYNVTGYTAAFASATGETVYDIAFDLADRFDAAQDTPWPLLYKELDRRYPGSKFILTVRSADSWISSVTGHFKDDHIPIHEWIYGVESAVGNEDVYLARFERHNREVREYFKDRPDDLLVMDITRGDGWHKLCSFLGMDEPPFDFPTINTFRERNRFRERVIRYLKRKLELPMQYGVSATVARDLVHYHYSAFEKVWEELNRLSEEQFAIEAPNSDEAIRAVITEQVAEETYWLEQLADETVLSEYLPSRQVAETKDELFERWRANMRLMRFYTANLTNEDSNARVGEYNAYVWEVLLHIVNAGVERRTRLQPLLQSHDVFVEPPSFIDFFRGKERP